MNLGPGRCRNCGKVYNRTRSWHRFCSTKCRMAGYWRAVRKAAGSLVAALALAGMAAGPAVASEASHGLCRLRGEAVLTGYCPCRKCCGKWAKYRRTASGARPVVGVTIAADTDIFPKGTVVGIVGHGAYIVQDTGKKVKDLHFDVFFGRHSEAKRFGVKRARFEVLSEQSSGTCLSPRW